MRAFDEFEFDGNRNAGVELDCGWKFGNGLDDNRRAGWLGMLKLLDERNELLLLPPENFRKLDDCDELDELPELDELRLLKPRMLNP